MAYHYHNAKGRPTSSKERERAPEASRERHTHHILFKKGPPMGPRARGSCRHNWWSNLGAMVVVFMETNEAGIEVVVCNDKGEVLAALLVIGHKLNDPL